jgi:TonB-linked SusC/RagA family outer membrane protein
MRKQIKKVAAPFILRVALLLLFPSILFAQKDVTGKVMDAVKNTPLEGATIFENISKNTTVTSRDGSFSFKVATNAKTITVSYTGYAAKTVSITESELVIKLEEDFSKLTEVVVTGLATSIKRSNAANSVGSINAKQLTGSTRPVTLDGAMQGKMPGAQITANSGAPGGGFSVRLRGVSSINQNSEPLYIIDGVYASNAQNATGAGTGPFSGATGQTSGTQDQAPNRLADLNPADIENIEILKGPSAAAIYGTRANAGVIIITTKKGKAGRTAMGFSQDIGMVKAINLIGMHKTSWDPQKIADGIWLVDNPDMLALFNANGAGAKTTDYEKLVYGNTGVHSNTRFTVSGGTDKARFYAAVGRLSETGIQKRTGYARNSVRLNADFKPTSWWDVGVATNYLNSTSDRSFSGNDNNGVSLGYNLAYLPNWLDQNPVNGIYPANPLTGQNPLEIVDKGINNEKVNRFIASFTSNMYLLRKDNQSLKFSIQGGVDYVHQENVVAMPEDVQFQRQRANPGASRFTGTRANNTNFQGFLVYNVNVNKFNLTTSVGAVRLDQQNRVQWFQAEGVPASTNNPQAAAVQLSSLTNGRFYDEGMVAQQEVNWDDKIIVTGGIRRDRSTLNGDKKKFYSFPKASMAVNIANFDFWKVKEINLLKIRAAYGQTGNSAQYGSLFKSLPTAAIGGATGYVTPVTLGNTVIQPEIAAEFEYGLDIALLNNRISFEATIYNKKVKDFIDVFNLSPGTGVNSIIAYNVGDFTNKGVEIGISSNVIKSTKVKWNTNISWYTNKTEITRMTIPEKPVAASGFGAFGTQRQRVGSSPTAWYGSPNVNGRPTEYEDAQPKWQASWSNNIVFAQNFEFAFLLHRSHKNFNSSLNQELTDEGGTSPDWSNKDKNGVPVGVARQLGQPGITTRQFIQDASFTKLREVSLYYTIPKSFLSKTSALRGVEQAKIGVSAQNVFVWTNYYGYDPEGANFGNRPTIAPVDLLSFPSARRMYFHLNVNF